MPVNFEDPVTVKEVSGPDIDPATALAVVYRMALYENNAIIRPHVAALALIYAAHLAKDFDMFDVEMESIQELINHGYIKAKTDGKSVTVTVLPLIA